MNQPITMKRSLPFMPVLAAVMLAAGCGSATTTRTTSTPATGTPVTSAPATDTPAAGSASDGFRVVDSAGLKVGIAGEVRERPTRTIEDENNIPWAPLPDAMIVVEDKSNTAIGKVKSDANGKFFLQLEPGTHYLRPQPFPGKMFPHPLPSQRVYVPEGEIVHVVLEYDTGIR